MNFLALERHTPTAGLLLRTWATWPFWKHNAAHALSLALGVLFWWRVAVGVLHGAPPLLAWMVSAYVSVWISVVLNWRILGRLLQTVDRYRPAMLLLQFTVTIAANTFVVVLIVASGVLFRPADWFVLGSATVGLAILGAFILSGRVAPGSDWALCWYSVSLKSAPQVIQAVTLFIGAAVLDPWSSVFLLGMGASRWWISHGMRSGDPASSRTRAQFTSASWDLVTIAMIAVAVIYRALT
jgi:hypothetical protein